MSVSVGMSKPTSLSLAEISGAIRAGRLSPVEITQAVLDEIDSKDGALNAYIDVYRDDALAQARQAERDLRAGAYRGPLHGIPMGIKDNLYFKGRVTTIGSGIHRDFIPQYSATVVDRLARAGVVFTGKLNLHEYALGVTTENPHFGTSRNPWNPDKITGGSSGGAGAAIPCGMSIGSIGSDTSGSIRIPAACCGIVGLKPTYGLVSKYGCFPEAWSLDHVGPMARTVADVALILDAIAGYDPRDPASLNRSPARVADGVPGDVKGKVIGIDEAFFFKDVDDAVAAVVRQGIRALEEQGAVVEAVNIPYIDSAEYALTIIDTSETSAVHHDALLSHPEEYGDDVRFLLQCGELPSAVDYVQAQQIRQQLRKSFKSVFDTVDAIAAPTLPIETPDIGQKRSTINGRPVDTVASLMRLVGPANLIGLPSVSVPCGALHGMPVGMQIIGAPLGEATVLTIARAVEQARLFTANVPDVARRT